MAKNSKQRKRLAPILCAAVVIALLGIYLGAALVPLVTELQGETGAVFFLVIYGLILLAVIVGILVALRQRLKEIAGGEEEDAKQY